jgi:hypothetical protein
MKIPAKSLTKNMQEARAKHCFLQNEKARKKGSKQY